MGVLVVGGMGAASHVDHITSWEICLDANRVRFCLDCTFNVDAVEK
jgi:hypothetical protein